jgi:hypothetical protein
MGYRRAFLTPCPFKSRNIIMELTHLGTSVLKPHATALSGGIAAGDAIDMTYKLDCIDINLNNMQQRVEDCEGVSPVVLEGSRQYFRQHHPRLRSVVIISIACRQAGIYGSAYRCGQVEHRLPGYEGLFVIVLNLHIYNMYGAIVFASSRQQV